MEYDELFDNGIDGTGWDNESEASADSYSQEDDYRESFDVVHANGLEIEGWPTYGNYTIITNMFHVYYWPGSNTLEIIKIKPGSKYAGMGDPHVLTLKNQDLYFFGEKTTLDDDGRWNVDWYTGEQVNQKIQRYLNLKAFL